MHLQKKYRYHGIKPFLHPIKSLKLLKRPRLLHLRLNFPKQAQLPVLNFKHEHKLDQKQKRQRPVHFPDPVIVKIVEVDPDRGLESASVFVFDRVLLDFVEEMLTLLGGLLEERFYLLEVLLELGFGGDLFFFGLKLYGLT